MRLTSLLTVVWASASLLATVGCGDGVTCPSAIVVNVASPGDGSTIATDTDPMTPGTQTTIEITSNLRNGDKVMITITAGDAVSMLEGTADSDGRVVLSNITLPGGAVTLKVEGVSSDECGSGVAEVSIDVAGQATCTLAVREGSVDRTDFDLNLPVLNTSVDLRTDLDDFQGNIDVTTEQGYTVEIFSTDIDADNTTSLGTFTADGNGMASTGVTLAQGRQLVRATCVSPNGSISESSAFHTFFVDTVAPTCSLDNPAAGSVIIPADDIDSDMAGTQIALEGSAAGGDVAGGAASFMIDGLSIDAPVLDDDGKSTATGSFAAPGTFTITFVGEDLAGNGCSASRDHDHITEGCELTLQQPAAGVTVLADSNGNSADGLQTDLVVMVTGTGCEGQVLTTNCNEDGSELSATVPSGGVTTIEVTLCGSDATCDNSPGLTCDYWIDNTAGIRSLESTTITVDTDAPDVTLIGISPSTLPCGQAVTPAINPIQVAASYSTAFADDAWIEVVNSAGTDMLTAPPLLSPVTVTLLPGANEITAVAVDEQTPPNTGRSATCVITLTDLNITVNDPVGSGLVGPGDGTVSGDPPMIQFDVSGTVSEAGAAMTVTIGGQMQMATAVGNDWTVTFTLGEGDYTMDIAAVSGMRAGLLQNVPFTVDLLPPPDPTALTVAQVINRQEVRLEWSSSDADSFVVKFADEEITAANFDSVGTVIPNPPTPSGTESMTVMSLRTGVPLWFAVVSLDSAGNPSAPAVAGPVTLTLTDTSVAVLPPTPAVAGELGWNIAAGRFNDDAFYDIAVAANISNGNAGEIFIYTGTANGLRTTPAYRITPTGTPTIGTGLTALQWDHDAAGLDDIAIGGPLTGTVWVIPGGAHFVDHAGATQDLALATLAGMAGATTITGDAGFGGMFVGWSLERLRFDDDGFDDLAIGIPFYGVPNFSGGVVVLYGSAGAPPATIQLSTTDASMMGGRLAQLMAAPIRNATPENFVGFGNRVTNIGVTTQADNEDLAIAWQQNVPMQSCLNVMEGAAMRESRDCVFVWRYPGKPAANSPVTVVAEDLATRDLQLALPVNPATTTLFGDNVGRIGDQNADSVGEVVVGAQRFGGDTGAIWIVDPNTVGTISVRPIHGANGLAEIIGAAGDFFGASIMNNATGLGSDLNNDGVDDLIVGSSAIGAPALHVWYGDDLPSGAATSATAHYTVAAPAGFEGGVSSGQRSQQHAFWVGDSNDDGLDDICWSEHTANDPAGPARAEGIFQCLR